MNDSKMQARKVEGMRNANVFISYDLGVTGDYDGLYSWLDNHDAKECGSGAAYITEFPFDDDLVSELKSNLEENVSLDKRTRIYIVYKIEKGLRGRFIYGHRKSPPWAGYRDDREQEIDAF